MAIEIPLSDWDRLTTELTRFGAFGTVTSNDSCIRLDFGSAYFEVTEAGSITSGMPLHNLDHEGDGTIIVDHETNSLTVSTDSLSYTFRRP